MASIVPRKGKKGISYRVLIRKLGVSDCASFPTKAQASAWATRREAEILAGARGFQTTHTVADAIDRFIRDVAPGRAGGAWEIIRLNLFLRLGTVTKKPMSKLTSDDMGQWRDARLRQVSPSSVAREMNLWRAVFNIAVHEWKWLVVNPIKGVKRPKQPPARKRGVTDDEITAIAKRLEIGPVSQQVAKAFEFGVETAMRAGEILNLTWSEINLKTHVAMLPKTKNGDKREVVLTSRAVEILESLKDNEKPFTVSAKSLDTLFRKARDAVDDCPSIKTLHFHDSRSEGVTRLSKRYNILDLAKIVGHNDLKSLMLYYHADAASLARRLYEPQTTSSHPPPPTGDAPAQTPE